jgi:hypothetical protein
VRVAKEAGKRNAKVTLSFDAWKEGKVEFPTKSGHGVKLYSACSYSAGDTYPSDECRRLLL